MGVEYDNSFGIWQKPFELHKPFGSMDQSLTGIQSERVGTN